MELVECRRPSLDRASTSHPQHPNGLHWSAAGLEPIEQFRDHLAQDERDDEPDDQHHDRAEQLRKIGEERGQARLK